MQKAILHYYLNNRVYGLSFRDYYLVEFGDYIKTEEIEDYNTLEDMPTLLLENLLTALDEDLEKHKGELKIDKLAASILNKYGDKFGLSPEPRFAKDVENYFKDKKLLIYSLKIMPGVIKEILDKREASPDIIDLEDLQEMKKKLKTCKTQQGINELFRAYSFSADKLFNNILWGNYTFNKSQLEKEAKKNYIEPSIFIKIIEDILALREKIKEVNIIEKDTDLYKGLSSTRLMKLLDFDKSKFKDPKDLVDKLKQSKPTFTEPAFMSTSTEFKIAEGFARRSTEGFPVIFKIKAKEGTAYGRDMSDISIFEEEKEILLRPGQKFKVLDAELTFDARGRKEVTISLETVKSETVKQ